MQKSAKIVLEEWKYWSMQENLKSDTHYDQIKEKLATKNSEMDTSNLYKKPLYYIHISTS